MQRQLRV